MNDGTASDSSLRSWRRTPSKSRIHFRHYVLSRNVWDMIFQGKWVVRFHSEDTWMPETKDWKIANRNFIQMKTTIAYTLWISSVWRTQSVSLRNVSLQSTHSNPPGYLCSCSCSLNSAGLLNTSRHTFDDSDSIYLFISRFNSNNLEWPHSPCKWI